ncbi:MAG: hypothetical protein DBX47_04345 [Clostridiales bacterium]|nr:MAG: hypothetical protein DBX47_04345 [Clostridiales bacterium]
MKFKVFVFVLVCMVSVFSLPVFANETDDIINRQKEDYNIEEIDDYIPDSARENAEEYGELSIENAKELIGVQTVFAFCWKSFLSVFGNKIRLVVELLALAFLMWLFNVMNERDKNPGLQKILSYATVAAAAVIFFETVFSASQTLISQCGELLTFLGALLPVLLTLTAAGGYGATASAVGVTTSFGLSIVAFLINSFIMPFTAMYMSLGIAAAMTDSVDFKRISQSIKNIVAGAFAGFFCVFSAVMVSQKYFALAGDSLSRRTLKLAAGSFLPLAGAGISEGVDTAFACAAVLRTSVGGLGVAVLFFTIIPPILEILATLIIISLARAICGFFENETLASFFTVISNVFMILLTVSALSALIIFLALAVLVKI